MSDSGNTHIFHSIIETWFRRSFEGPTPAQRMGWPPIFNNENTLILAPTGSGKTLAAFLVCINQILVRLLEDGDCNQVHTLYISPLKALNYDIERNLEEPLAGIQKVASEQGYNLPPINKAVRTGDTTPRERERMLRHPPHILITTPESLHLLLTSDRAREILKNIRNVIVDEIHALSENKRGTFLCVLLERLAQLTGHDFTRIGLSATQKPLDEIALFLAGFSAAPAATTDATFTKRPIRIVDAGMRKKLLLQVISPVNDFRHLPENSIWPDIYDTLFTQVKNHRTTLIFANNRAIVERVTAELNNRAGYELVRAHHGSVSKRHRQEIEAMLKAGRIPALVATATLELGIDMGSIDLVCQVESPKSVARGLQRVGRAGHLYKSESSGIFIPKMRSDLLELAVLVREMKQGNVAPIKIPQNCLDILAQQIVAIVATQPYDVDKMYTLFRCAYPFHHLPYSQFIGVLDMLSGRYPATTFKNLKPRISWDRINNVLYPLPGTKHAAIMGGGAIPDSGQFGCYLEDGITKLGELEEEFVHERRINDVFVLGTANWRIKKITHDRIIVSPAPGELARTPFWKGEFTYRSVHLGRQIGVFNREFKKRLSKPDCMSWLQNECDLDDRSAENLIQYFSDQLRESGVIPDDQTLLLETFPDELGDLRIIILSTYGGRLHLPWRLAIIAKFRSVWNIEPESWHSDVGLMFRFNSNDIDTILNIITSIGPENVEDLVINELANSPFFGLRFRQNANRAMLLPRAKPGKRSPLWLQRLLSRDLLEITQQYPAFPIVLETYRECMNDYFAMDELKELLRSIETHDAELITRRDIKPSPFSASLLFNFTGGFMYEYDAPKTQSPLMTSIEKESIRQLLQPNKLEQLLAASAIDEVQSRLQAVLDNYRARNETEFFELLRRLGDLTDQEAEKRLMGDKNAVLSALSDQGRIVLIDIPHTSESRRWITTEDLPLYRSVFPGLTLENDTKFPLSKADAADETATYERSLHHIIDNYIENHVLFSASAICERYPIDTHNLMSYLERLASSDQLLKFSPTEDYAEIRWGRPELLERTRRVTLKQQRQRIQPCIANEFQSFLFKWHHVSEPSGLLGFDEFADLVDQYQGLFLPAEIWEAQVFGKRIAGYSRQWLDELTHNGELIWYGETAGGGDWGNLAFSFKENLNLLYHRSEQIHYSAHLIEVTAAIRRSLEKRGASFLNDIVADTESSLSQCQAALWEMIWHSEVTNDSFQVIRNGKPVSAAIDPHRSSHYTRKGRMASYRRPSHAMRISGGGRWSLLPGAAETNPGEESTEKYCRHLLRRHGLLCRELYDAKTNAIPWSALYDSLIKMEWRGEIERGYFVSSLSGIQFALPEAASALLSLQQAKASQRHDGPRDEEHYTILNTCDPANMFGAASPFPLSHPVYSEWRLLRHPNNYLIYLNGSPIIAVEAKGSRLTPLRDLSQEQLFKVLSLLPKLLEDPSGWQTMRRLKIEMWDQHPIRNSEAVSILKELGFRDEFKAMILEKTI